jgi:hypothetical protein
VSALAGLREKQARALFEAFKIPSDAVSAVTACTKNIVSDPIGGRIDVLTTLIVAYRNYIDQELSLRRKRLVDAAIELRTAPDAPGILDDKARSRSSIG